MEAADAPFGLSTLSSCLLVEASAAMVEGDGEVDTSA
jgi:hypothetical protein